MTETRKYRIRVGRLMFKEPHYITRISERNGCDAQMISVNRHPMEWVQLKTAKFNLVKAKLDFPSAEIETHFELSE